MTFTKLLPCDILLYNLQINNYSAAFSEKIINIMPKYVAFLRAINVGGHTVKMDYLRQLFEQMGFFNVETFIASGNVIFDSTSQNTKELERNIEASLQETLGYRVATFIRTTDEVADIAHSKPFRPSDLAVKENVLYIAFVAETPSDEGKQKLLALTTSIDEFYVDGCEVYWLYRRKVGESDFSGALLEKTLGIEATLRNSRTIQRITAKYA